MNPTDPITLLSAPRVSESAVGDRKRTPRMEIPLLAVRRYRSGGEGQVEGADVGRTTLTYAFARSPATEKVRRGWLVQDRGLPGQPTFRVIAPPDFLPQLGHRWIRVTVEREEVT